MSESNKLRRKRAVNYTVTENRKLIALVMEFRDVIENKKSDAVTWVEKKNAWIEIEKKFNTTNGDYYRTAEGLRSKYEAMKKDLRKKAADPKNAALKTGAGETLFSISRSPSPLSTVEDLNNTLIVRDTSLPSCSQKVVASSNNKLISKSAEASRNWKPNSAKARRSGTLHIKKRSAVSAHSKFAKLAEAKNDLVQLQLEVQEADAAFKATEHDMKMQLLQEELDLTIQQRLNKEIMYQKKIELLNKQLIEQNLKNELLELELKKLK